MTWTRLKLPAQQEVKREINFNGAAAAHGHGDIKVTGQGPWGGDNLPPGPGMGAGGRGTEWAAGGQGPATQSDLSLCPLSADHSVRPHPLPGLRARDRAEHTARAQWMFVGRTKDKNAWTSAGEEKPQTASHVPDTELGTSEMLNSWDPQQPSEPGTTLIPA